MNRIVVLSLIFIFSCELLNSPDIDSAINLDFYSDTFQNEILSLPKNEKIVLYCRTNNRSSKTATILKENGYKDILVIRGGITEWVKNGNDINYTTYSD